MPANRIRIIVSSCSTPKRAPTSGTGARTAGSRMMPPRLLPSIRPVLRRSNSAAPCTAFDSIVTASCTSAIAATADFRSSQMVRIRSLDSSPRRDARRRIVWRARFRGSAVRHVAARFDRGLKGKRLHGRGGGWRTRAEIQRAARRKRLTAIRWNSRATE